MKEGMIIPCDSEGSEMDIGDYVRYEGELWEIEDYEDFDEERSWVWLSPRAGNEELAQWAVDADTTLTDISQLRLDI